MSTPLHMNVDACTQAQVKLNQFIEETKTNLGTQKATMDSLVGSEWIAPAASQYQSEFEQINQNMTQLLERFNQLSETFKGEIAQWTETGSALNAFAA